MLFISTASNFYNNLITGLFSQSGWQVPKSYGMHIFRHHVFFLPLKTTKEHVSPDFFAHSRTGKLGEKVSSKVF